ncbi:hypothetical protein HPB51_011780 [Rhipicephalus microplus]|uniref:Uncharacterized protein n=1 Tax=Rhipicephalus microplus TaxID=6941 RepID=A0A9J6E112_RHIMP|nr:hypothetical protein HPB51_011780 [Rhipicephalus microplus]
MAVHPPAPILHLLRPRHRLRGLFAVFARTARRRNLIRTPAPCTAQHPQWLPTRPPLHSLLAGHLHCGIRSPFPVPRQLRFATAQCPLHMVHALLRLYIALSGYHWSSRDLVIPSGHSTDVPDEASTRIPVHAELPRPRSHSGHDTGPHDQGPVSPTHRAVLSARDSSFSSMTAPASSGTLRRLRSSSSLSSNATSHAPDLSEDLGGDDIDYNPATPPVDHLVMELPPDHTTLLGELTRLLRRPVPETRSNALCTQCEFTWDQAVTLASEALLFTSSRRMKSVFVPPPVPLFAFFPLAPPNRAAPHPNVKQMNASTRYVYESAAAGTVAIPVAAELSDICRIDLASKLLTTTDRFLRDMALYDAYLGTLPKHIAAARGPGSSSRSTCPATSSCVHPTGFYVSFGSFQPSVGSDVIINITELLSDPVRNV